MLQIDFAGDGGFNHHHLARLQNERISGAEPKIFCTSFLRNPDMTATHQQQTATFELAGRQRAAAEVQMMMLLCQLSHATLLLSANACCCCSSASGRQRICANMS